MNPEIDEQTGIGPEVLFAQEMCRQMLQPTAFHGIPIGNGTWPPKDTRVEWMGAISVDRRQVVMACGPGWQQRTESRPC